MRWKESLVCSPSRARVPNYIAFLARWQLAEQGPGMKDKEATGPFLNLEPRMQQEDLSVTNRSV